MYIQKNSWHNVTPSSTGYSKKEYLQHLTELQADEDDYKKLRLLIEHAEVGRYTECKNLLNDAHAQFQKMQSLVIEKRQVRQSTIETSMFTYVVYLSLHRLYN